MSGDLEEKENLINNKEVGKNIDFFTHLGRGRKLPHKSTLRENSGKNRERGWGGNSQSWKWRASLGKKKKRRVS